MLVRRFQRKPKSFILGPLTSNVLASALVSLALGLVGGSLGPGLTLHLHLGHHGNGLSDRALAPVNLFLQKVTQSLWLVVTLEVFRYKS